MTAHGHDIGPPTNAALDMQLRALRLRVAALELRLLAHEQAAGETEIADPAEAVGESIAQLMPPAPFVEFQEIGGETRAVFHAATEVGGPPLYNLRDSPARARVLERIPELDHEGDRRAVGKAVHHYEREAIRESES